MNKNIALFRGKDWAMGVKLPPEISLKERLEELEKHIKAIEQEIEKLKKIIGTNFNLL